MQEGAFEQAESALLESWKLLGEERSNGVEGGLPNDELVPRAREVADYIIGLYDSWEKARPGIGMSTKAATWRTTRSSMKSAAETGGP
jgi:hypothetical protein